MLFCFFSCYLTFFKPNMVGPQHWEGEEEIQKVRLDVPGYSGRRGFECGLP
jgi:hypothetical protein